MEQITLLLLAGWAAAIAAIAVVAIKGFTNVSPTTTAVFAQAAIAEVPAVQPSETASIEAPAAEPVSVPSSLVAEAPPPFPEDGPTTSSTSIPVDVTAVSNIANPTEIAAPALVINTPKRRTRTRKLPTDPSAPRRRRATKPKQISATPGTVDPVSIPTQVGDQPAQNQA